MSEHEDTPLEEIAAGVTIGLILTVAFGLLALGVSWFWIVFPIGFAGVLPAVMGLVKLYERRRERERAGEDESDVDPLDQLRDRYARGELSDAEFERKLDRLLETETHDGAKRAARRDSRVSNEQERVLDPGFDPDLDVDVDVDLERE
ncbi:SHOCT domain-containing protein [Natronosalvus vescus]|uniref:SHOCT domain-containing protein n=1 Tax=Natronosalvus vescus TaxID=2953881 RepID=UPI0020912453|nr:SHOCT domain-containing protein [Natronosalvus vescus]